MPRRPRPQLPDATYHVTARGVDGLFVFRDDDDRWFFLTTLSDIVRDRRWAFLAYCLLGTHYHLLVRTPDADIAAGMQRLNGEHARRYNRRYGRTGHVFERRYYSGMVTSDRHLLATARYIALNPVDAGVAADPADWPWCSHRAVISKGTGTSIARSELLSHFAAWGGDPVARYRDFVAAGTPSATPPQPDRPCARALAAELGREAGLLAAYRDHGLTLQQIADDLGCNQTTVGRRLRALRSTGA